ncbi:MAG TPA: choice-of-anchor tandem repeat GloVer-containing protein, partial [Bryobacteraceae bacterium]|nr:choice-of-anchor tandem repeat GloVer-containing protein [Bryobacteraceae bacterium]
MKTYKARTYLRAAVLLAVAVSGSSLAQAQTLTTIRSFAGGNDGEYPFPVGRIPFDSNGALYGTTAAGGGSGNNGTVFQLVPPTVQGGAWTENVLYRFAGGADGRQPGTGLVFDAIGNLYGATQFGGNAQACGGGCGTIFELSPPTQQGGQWT